MPDFILRDFDPEEFSKLISERVIAAIRTILTEANEPRLEDRVRMAELLSISVPSLDREVADGAIPSKLIGSRRLFEPAAVIASIPNATGPVRLDEPKVQAMLQRATTCDQCGGDVAYSCAAELWCQNCGTLEPQSCDCERCKAEQEDVDDD